MMRLTIAVSLSVAMLLAGVLIWETKATALTASPNTSAKDYSPVQQTGCVFAGRHCRAGFKWVCGPYAAPMGQRCRCAPC
jgi:hypothetical protein